MNTVCACNVRTWLHYISVCVLVQYCFRCRERDFLKKLLECVEKGGKVLIPVFALGRAQELCILLETLWWDSVCVCDVLIYCLWCITIQRHIVRYKAESKHCSVLLFKRNKWFFFSLRSIMYHLGWPQYTVISLKQAMIRDISIQFGLCIDADLKQYDTQYTCIVASLVHACVCTYVWYEYITWVWCLQGQNEP